MKEISFRNDILPLKEKLFRTALRITMDSAEAEDVVQDTLIRVWNKREEWPNIISIEAYCMTICRNLALDRNERMGTDYIEIDEKHIVLLSSGNKMIMNKGAIDNFGFLGCA